MKIFKFFKGKFFKWVDARVPRVNEVQLRQRNIYILPTRYGWLMLIIILLILVASTNYQNNMGFMSGFILLAIGVLSIFYTYRNLRQLRIKSLKPSPVFAGDEVSFIIQLDNITKQTRSSVGLGINKKNLSFIDVETMDSNSVTMNFKSLRRGLFTPPRITCSSFFPFGIFQVWSWFKSPYQCLVYPKPIKPMVNLFEGADGDEEGNRSQKGSEDFYSIKEYQQGDPIKQVMWKAFARERGLLTKEFEDKVGEQQLFTWNSVAHIDTELALSYLCHGLLEADKKNIDFGLQLPNLKLELSNGTKHLHSCLEALAKF